MQTIAYKSSSSIYNKVRSVGAIKEMCIFNLRGVAEKWKKRYFLIDFFKFLIVPW